MPPLLLLLLYYQFCASICVDDANTKQLTLSISFIRTLLKQMADRHFPLCMQNMHARLISESHLRYGGRLTYGLFLKVSMK